MGKKLDLLFGRTSRHIAKLNTLLNLAISRTAVLRNHRQVRCNQTRSDVRKLLETGQIDSALISVEQFIKDQNMFDVFVMIESYSSLLADRLVLLEHTRECPQELKETAASLIFAASRCGELTELHEIKGVMKSMFGSEFVSAAVELRNNCGVNPKMIYKLSTRQPGLEVRQKALKDIALETGIKLNFDHESSSEIAEVSSTVINLNEFVDNDDNFSTPKKYKDVKTAAQAAFQSAAIAAEAARAVVQLSRVESQGKGSDEQSRKGGQTLSKVHKKSKDDEADSDNSEPEIQMEEKIRKQYGKELGRSPSSSSFDSTEDKLESIGNTERSFETLPSFAGSQQATSVRQSSEISTLGNYSEEQLRMNYSHGASADPVFMPQPIAGNKPVLWSRRRQF